MVARVTRKLSPIVGLPLPFVPFGCVIRENQLCKNRFAFCGRRSGFASSQESALRYSAGRSIHGKASPRRASCFCVTAKCWPENESDGVAGAPSFFFRLPSTVLLLF